MKYFNIEMYQKCEIAHYILDIYISNNEHLDFFNTAYSTFILEKSILSMYMYVVIRFYMAVNFDL